MYKKETNVESVLDMVYLKHNYITMPTMSKADVVLHATKELAKAIKNNLRSMVPATNNKEIRKLSKILDEIAKEKVPEEKWEEPVVARVLKQLRMGTFPRVAKPKEKRPTCPRVPTEDEDEHPSEAGRLSKHHQHLTQEQEELWRPLPKNQSMGQFRKPNVNCHWRNC